MKKDQILSNLKKENPLNRDAFTFYLRLLSNSYEIDDYVDYEMVRQSIFDYFVCE